MIYLEYFYWNSIAKF